LTLAGFSHATVKAVRQTMRRRRRANISKDAAKPDAGRRSGYLVKAVRAVGRRS
jgi:hypothetical protein